MQEGLSEKHVVTRAVRKQSSPDTSGIWQIYIGELANKGIACRWCGERKLRFSTVFCDTRRFNCTPRRKTDADKE